ncbi:spondin-1 [Anoplophora glabripennis]|nr:spondin-1 [Anoplophora glabripennis]
MVPGQLLLYFSIFLSLVYKSSSVCNKIPDGVVKLKNRNVAGKYFIEIAGNPKNYTPLQRYNVSLKSGYPQKAFINFMITLEPDDPESEDHALGHLGFEYDTEMLARFSHSCPNTIVETSTIHKKEIRVHWIAPPSGSGCVNIKATVVESKENWFSEDESLTKKLCEETLEDENVQPIINTKCCACDEAKYELAFEGKWTRNTHPRHFPIDQWNTKFSDVIGASHQLYHAFWKYEATATDGLKELAQTGEIKTLESELKNDSGHIRTIIKARGLQYPNITKSTYAVFRVDKKNHLVSLVTKIIPSPDWIVGVANLELCTENCTWKETVSLNLYPWDVGIDNGLDYESSEPTQDWQPVRRITPNNPNDPKSPFFSEEGEEMKPIAKLRVTRQRLYSKVCENETEVESDCSRTDWLNWTPCSNSCGTGLKVRQRAHMNEEQATQCGLNFVEHKICFVDCPADDNESSNENDNSTKNSVCKEGDKNCEEDPNCPDTFWGPWGPCNATCGKGTKRRLRISKQEIEDGCDTSQEVDCDAANECNSESESTSEPSNQMFAGLGPSSIILSQGPVGEVINCKVSRWSSWSECILQQGVCGRGSRYKFREIKVHPANGGNRCPKNLSKVQDCEIRCPSSVESQECVMSEWSSWTPCTTNCGDSAVQIRTRQIVTQPPGVKSCPPRKERKQCHLPLACTKDGQPILNG